MLYWLLVIPVLAVLILVHEVGHFLAALWMRVRVLEFGIGFPPRMATLAERNGIRYSLNWIPIGGFVEMAGEEDATVAGGLAQKPPWRRALVLSAGSLMNLLLAFFIFTGLALVPHDVVTVTRIGVVDVIPGTPAERAGLQTGDILLAVGDHPVREEMFLMELALNGGLSTTLTLERDGQVLTRTVVPSVDPVTGLDHIGVTRYAYEMPEARLDEVFPDGPAYRAGLRAGDVILSLDGYAPENNLDFLARLGRRREEGGPLVFVVRRDGRTLSPMTVYPPPPEDEEGLIGIRMLAPKARVRLSLFEAVSQGLQDTAEAVLLVPRILGAIFRGSMPVGALAGPIGIAEATVDVARASQAGGVLQMMALLSANLFVVNLLPLPALDGGRIFFLLLEVLRGGRRIPHHWEVRIHKVGLFLLLGLLVLATVFDILRLVSPAGP